MIKYNVFVEAMGTAAFQFDFLAKAVSDNEIRLFMNYIYVEPSDKEPGALRAAATDGRRLHLVDPLDGSAAILGISPGFWKVLKHTAKTAWIARVSDETAGEEKYAYPNYRKVMPSGEAEHTTTFSGFSFAKRSADYRGLAEFIRGFPETTVLNLTYLQSLGTGFDWDVEWRGQNKALKFTEGERTAVIMPMLGLRRKGLCRRRWKATAGTR